MVEKEKGDRNIPTVAEVLEFGHSIGLSGITITQVYENWWNVLHEMAHFAVKPDSILSKEQVTELWMNNAKKHILI